jgi:transposase
MSVCRREDLDAGQLRRQASRCDDGNQARRLLAIAALYDGMSRAEAARIGGMDRQTLRDWVSRFNEEGPEGLLDRKANGASPKLTASQLAELAAVVESGPDPVSDGIVRWRRIDLKVWIEAQFGVVYHDRSVSRLLAQLGLYHDPKEALFRAFGVTGLPASFVIDRAGRIVGALRRPGRVGRPRAPGPDRILPAPARTRRRPGAGWGIGGATCLF